MYNKSHKALLCLSFAYCMFAIVVFIAGFEGGLSVFYIQFAAPFSLLLQFVEFVLVSQGIALAIGALAVYLLLWFIVGVLEAISLKKNKKWSILVYITFGVDAVVNLLLMNLFGLVGDVALILLQRNAINNDNA